jgi:hypothetical protein
VHTVLVQAHAFDVLHGFARENSRRELAEFPRVLFGREVNQRTTHDLFLRPSEHALGRLIPGRYLAIQADAHDGIVRALYDCGEPALRLPLGPTRGRATHDCDTDRPARAFRPGERYVDGDLATISMQPDAVRALGQNRPQRAAEHFAA